MKAPRPKIMVVDDDDGMRITLEAILDEQGYDVVGVGNGHNAIELASRDRFLLIFMDIKMPGINGVEAYKEIKKVSPASVVVMMTGFSVEELVKEALREGAYAVLYKPFAMEQILGILQRVVRSTSVLVVDDRPTDRQVLRAILEDNGYQVSEARDGNEAVRMAAETHYGVILMDIRMSGIGGVDAFERILQVDPLAKVIFITGYTLEKPVKEALLNGAYTVLTKPVEPPEMLALVKSIAGCEGS